MPLSPWTQRLAHACLWGLIGVSALGGVAGLVRAPDTAAPVERTVSSNSTAPASVAGFAEFAVRSWLVHTESSDSLLESLYATDPGPAHTDQAIVGYTSAVASRLVETRYWAVTVAAHVDEPADGAATVPWFFEVGIVEDGAGAFMAVGTPALLPAPRVAVDPPTPLVSTLRRPDPRDPIATTVRGFLQAMLAGGGDVSRYAAPDVTLTAISPAPFLAFELTGEASQTLPSGEVRFRAEVRGTSTADDTWTVAYELVLAERGGRWEVRSVSGAPTLGSPPPSTTTTATTSPSVATTATTVASEPGA